MPGPAGATMEYATKASKFQNVHTLDLHFPGNVGGGDATRVDFVGLKGSHTPAKREAVVAVYEARPVPGDHKVGGGKGKGEGGGRRDQSLRRNEMLRRRSPLPSFFLFPSRCLATRRAGLQTCREGGEGGRLESVGGG